MNKYLFLTLILLLIIGCGTKEIILFTDKEYKPTTKCVLIENLENSEYEYEIIGEINKKVNDILESPEEEMKNIFEQAMNNGADAITGVKQTIFSKKKQTIKYRESDKVKIKMVRFTRDTKGNPIKKKKSL